VKGQSVVAVLTGGTMPKLPRVTSSVTFKVPEHLAVEEPLTKPQPQGGVNGTMVL